MKEAEDIIFGSDIFSVNDDTYNTMNSNNYIGNASYGGGGGGGSTTIGGGGVSSGAGAGVVLSSTPNTVLSDRNFIINVLDNANGAIYINDENTYKVAPDSVSISVAEVLKHGRKYISVVKDGYEKSIKYSVGIKENPSYKYSAEPISFNPASNIFSGMSGMGYNGWNQINQIPTYNSFSNNPYYSLRFTKIDENGVEQEIILDDINSTNVTARFELTKINQKTPTDPIPSPSVNTNVLTVNLNGDDDSAIVSILDNGKTTNVSLKSGINQISAPLGSKASVLTSAQLKYRVTSITVASNEYDSKTIESSTENESISTSIDITSNSFNFDIKTLAVKITPSAPAVISFTNQDDKREYNINSNADYPIGITKSSEVNKIRIFVNNQTFTFSNLDTSTTFVGIIPARIFDKIGNYKIIIVPSNQYGDGDTIECIVHCVDAAYIGVPDIRNIHYPSLLKGPDYVGTNVDFSIAYDSINTDYVRIYKEGSSQYIKATSAGVVNLNFQSLLNLDRISIPEDQSTIDLTLKLIPYNEQGKEIVIGKEEFITIHFQKGQLTIPRDLAINRIAEGFVSQFDTINIEDDTSKYLTHLLHLGDGNNKVITTWAGSEGSLILKLYEPIPTSVQPNQQVWISKLQANPIIETITLSSQIETSCPPLKGPNFSLEVNNSIAYQVYDDLIASGSVTSNDLVTNYLNTNGIDTTKLNISYTSGSNYSFENFVHFSSAEERINNFFYKIQLIEGYKTKYEQLSQPTFIPQYGGYDGGMLTEDGYQEITEDGIFDIQWEVAQFFGISQANEAKKVLDNLNYLIKSLDGFENFLYKSNSNLAYPKELYIHPVTGLGKYILKPTNDSGVQNWYDTLVKYSAEYDKYNENYLVNNIPEFISEDYTNNDFLVFLDMIGQHFDILWSYINNLSKTKILENKQVKGFSNDLVYNLLESFGWNPKRAFNSEFLWEYAFGTYKDGYQKYSMPLKDANNEVWRRILNNLPYLLKHKGTARAMKAIMACYGVPQSMLTIMEFGGPQDPDNGNSSKFTFDDRTAAIYLKGDLNNSGSSAIKIPWKQVVATNDYPDCVEFRILPAKYPSTKYSLISGSEWSLDLIQTTSSFAKLELNFGGNDSTSTYFSENINDQTSYYISYINNEPYAYGPDYKTGSLDFPISTEHYSNIAINRHNNPDSSSWFEVWLATSDGHRIITSVSMSIATVDTQWETGTTLQVGGNGYEGNVDEFRLWTVPLQRSKFENHTLFPDAINGNDYDSSTKDLLFRLDFEYPKNRVLDPNIKNVSINTEYTEDYGYAYNMYSAVTYPYQYTPYDRTVTATVPSLGLTYSNKIRFEDQEMVTDLSYKSRATKKSFDRAPIDSNRLGLFFSPIKELNMDILKTFGDFNVDNYIGDPSDEYKDKYSQLDTLRHYYFERLGNRDIYEYIRLVRYIDKSLFDVLADLAPARAKVSKGLLIEPHYLERSKTRWDKPAAENDNRETKIDISESNKLDLTYDVKNVYLDATEVVTLTEQMDNYDTLVDANEIYKLNSVKEDYGGLIDYTKLSTLIGDAPFYDTFIQAAYTGSSITGEVDSFTFTEVGMDKNSLANAGFGLYATNGTGIIHTLDTLFGNYSYTGSRQNIYLIKEKYQQKIPVQVAGYPTTRSLTNPGEQVKYSNEYVTKYRYKVSVLPFSGSVAANDNIVEITALNGYFPTHYKYKNNLSEGMKRSYFNGSLQTAATTPDGLDPVETFTTNPNILRVAKTGRGSGEPILEVD